MKSPSLKSAVIGGSFSLALVASAFAGDSNDEFKNMDTNVDGRVTSAEHIAFSQMVFKQSDANQDGKVSASEWDAAASAAKPDHKMNKQETAAHLRMMDTDGDGLVNEMESTRFAATMFAKADKDSDGALSEKECKAAAKEMKKTMKQGT